MARVTPEFLAELKARVRLSDVVGRRVKLKRQGKDFVGLSPFSNEKTPSFRVHDAEGYYKCFSTQKSGDVFTFLMETERLTFTEAVEKLALETGTPLPAADPAEAAKAERRAGLHRWAEAAAQYYEMQLRSPAGTAARDYLERRGFGPEVWTRHRIGFAPPGWRNLLEHLKSRGAQVEDLLEAGLVSRKEEGRREPWDFFRNRVMFPISDPQGRVIAFGARAIDPADQPKYLNSGDGPLFHKGKVVYRYAAAREALAGLAKDDPLGRGLIVCEGYVDAIALAEAGMGTAVAPLGTAFTSEQLELVWRAGEEPILCFDGDRAGRRAAEKAVDLALPLIGPGRSVFFAFPPDGLDPDDLIRRQGADAMRAVLLAHEPMVEVLWRRELAAGPADTPERRAGLEARLKTAVYQIQDPTVRRNYWRVISDKLYWIARDRRPGVASTGPAHVRAGPARGADPVGGQPLSGLVLLAWVIDSPALAEPVVEELAGADFADPDVSALRDVICEFIVAGRALDREQVRSHLRTLGRTRSIDLLTSIPTTASVSPITPQGRERLDAIRRFAVDSRSKDAPDPIAGRHASGVGSITQDEFARSRAAAAERQRLREQTSHVTEDGASQGQDEIARSLEELAEVMRRRDRED